MYVQLLFLLPCVYLMWCALKFYMSYRRKMELCKDIPRFPDSHPIWGMLHVITDGESLYRLTLDYVKTSRVKLFHGWYAFFHPEFYPCHPETLKIILKSSQPKDHGFGRPYTMLLDWIGDGLLVSEGKKWERNRRLLTPAFHYDILQNYFPEYNDVSRLLTAKISELSKENESVDVCPLISCATMDTMLRCTLTYTDHIQQEGKNHPYVAAINRLTELITLRCFTVNVRKVFKLITIQYNPLHYLDFVYYLTKEGQEFRRHTNFVHSMAEELIRERRKAVEQDPSILKKRRLDFLDILITARDGDGRGLTNQEIRDEVDTFMFEGHDTTASALDWALYCLAKYPKEQDAVFREVYDVMNGTDKLGWQDIPHLEYLSRFLKESMRLYSPVPGFARRLTSPMTIDGVTFPEGTIFGCLIDVINRNPDVWTNPESFNPDRFLVESRNDMDPYSYTPFSAGPRNCIGQVFAKNEMKVILSHIVKTFRIELDPKHEPKKFPDLVMRSANGIYLKFMTR